jgi:hypothetical protein
MKREKDIVMGESTNVLEGSCSQSTLKNKRLEHQSYRQERNFIDTERLSEEHTAESRNRVPPERRRVELFMYVKLCFNMRKRM